jgi:hypothetical protein
MILNESQVLQKAAKRAAKLSYLHNQAWFANDEKIWRQRPRIAETLPACLGRKVEPDGPTWTNYFFLRATRASTPTAMATNAIEPGSGTGWKAAFADATPTVATNTAAMPPKNLLTDFITTP